MLSPRWRKVLRDLWVNKARTLLVALSIAVGVFAVGTVAHMQYIINEDLMRSYEAVNPAQAIIHTAEGFDDAFVTAVRRMDEVQEVEGRRSFTVKFRRPDDDAWHAMQVFAIPNYEDIRINKVLPETVFDP
ncbi:MAG: ABC transporter permease, partial [Chloroflexi bacterium]|nr:ABC transporter permease [Chloroflexota bacterium]